MLTSNALHVDVDRALAEYRANGYARLGKIASDETLAALRARCDDLMLGRAEPALYQKLFFQHDSPTGKYGDLEFGKGFVGPSLRYRKIEKLEHDPLFRAWLANALFEKVARAWHGEQAIAIYRALVFAKAAGGGTELPWHQDGGSFWGLSQDPDLQIWTAIDDAPEGSGCVELIARSHTAGLATRLGGTIPDDVVATRAKEPVVTLPALAGEAILIHNHVWHRSGINRTDHPRRAFTVCYMSASTRCLRKRRAPRSFETIFQARSADGAPSNPDGLTSSTTIKIAKTSTSTPPE